MIYTVTFNPAIDYVVRLDRELAVGDVNRAKGEDCVLGGKGINVSGVLAQLGCESVALGFVAGETAMQAVEEKLDRLQKGDILILAGSIPASLAQTTYERILARLEGRDIRAVVDATRDLLVNVLRYKPFLIKPNNHELSDGALLLDEQGGVHRIGCPKGKVVNSVGAGDSMVAGFVAGYQQSGGDYAAALKLGTACGSATAFSLGLATKADIDKLLKTM